MPVVGVRRWRQRTLALLIVCADRLATNCCRKYEVKSVEKFEEENECELPKVCLHALHVFSTVLFLRRMRGTCHPVSSP
jgi:hypothetical protein